MTSYVITDRSTENTQYYAGLNGWVNLPENSVWYESEKSAHDQRLVLNNAALMVESIETE